MTIWQNVPFEDEAAIKEWANKNNIKYSVIKCYENEPLYADDLLIVLGGSMSAYDDIDFIKKEIEFLENHIKEGKKVFGICLGAQLIAKALKAEVYSSKTREIGWREIEVFPHILTSNLKQKQIVFHWHGDTFDLPKDTIKLASNDAFINQAFATKNGFVVGTQFHFETNEDSLKSILKEDSEYINFDSPYIQNIEEIKEGKKYIKETNKALFDLLDVWKNL
ncbi:type 1 glutamine amidotransferase [Aliarcobacter butzleri]|uniref:type 1 glutamine amidotransferase n=1 Tax=Aliarcobacter butzleri TaxID=28197 RepID=UPI0021B4204F|nr:type 1 glutamine amidotransferase [Aliarcobacter butzleri]MCT7586929.1 type 1 glutamine amidotransferase [Aliarcobacter butzleri]